MVIYFWLNKYNNLSTRSLPLSPMIKPHSFFLFHVYSMINLLIHGIRKLSILILLLILSVRILLVEYELWYNA